MDIKKTFSGRMHSCKTPLLAISTLLLTACGGSDSNSSDNNALNSSFNLSTLSAANLSNTDGSGTVRQLALTWENAAESSAATGISYTICASDDSQENGCAVLAEVSDTLSTTIELDSLINALSESYFVIASNEDESVSSSEMNLSAETITEMIGYFKASNTQSGQYFGYSIAMSADGETLAISAYRESSAASGINGDEVYADEVEDEDGTVIEESVNYASSAGAVYIYKQIDGIWQKTAYLKASNSEERDSFGIALALSANGNTLAVSANYEDSNGSDESNNDASNSGAVYLFSYADNNWVQSDYLKSSNPDASDNFGYSLSISADGSTLAVGATSEDSDATGIDGDDSNNNVSGSGAVYLFSEGDSGWAQTAYIKASNNDGVKTSDGFGYSVTLDADGDTLVVGATSEDSDGSSEDNNDASAAGAAYVFTKSDSVWSQTAYLKASNAEAGDYFGYAVSLSDDGQRVAISAYKEDSATTGIDGEQYESDEVTDEDDNVTEEAVNWAKYAGAVYMFDHDGSNWNQTAYIKASNTGASDYFGFALVLSGDGKSLVVGATSEDSVATGLNSEQQDNDDASGSGAVYRYIYNDAAWIQSTYIKSSNTSINDGFGRSLSISEDGSILAVGAYGEDTASTGVNGEQYSADETEESESVNYASGAGAVYLF